MKKLKQKAPAANAIATMNTDEMDGDCSVKKKKDFWKFTDNTLDPDKNPKSSQSQCVSII